MKEISLEMGESDEASKYAKYEEGAVNAYRYLYLKEIPDTDRQAKLVRPIALDMAQEGQKKLLAERLFKSVLNRNYRIATGFLSTPFILPVLSDYGRSDLAYKMLVNEEAPGWMHEVVKGATTVWEDWEGTVSRNHYSPGAVSDWLYKYVLGIKIISERKFFISPKPSEDLEYAQGHIDTIYGRVSSRWNHCEEGLKFEIEIPANTSADIELPNGKIEHVDCGKYIFLQK